MALSKGDKIPEILGVDQDNKEVKASEKKKKKLILYFYPKDNTPGCTAEACNLRDNHDIFLEKGFAVVGVSMDSEKSHKNFAQKYSLPFPLIADTTKSITDAYGVWKEKKMYGRTFLGIARTTFVINEEGIIEKIISKVDTKEHSEQIFGLYK